MFPLLHTNQTKIQAYKHQVQGELPEWDGKNGLSALYWSAHHNEMTWVQKVSTDQALLNLRQDVWLLCCKNSPLSKPNIAHSTSWAIGWVCLGIVTKTAGSPPPYLEFNSFSGSATHGLITTLPELSGCLVVIRVVSDTCIRARFYVSGKCSGIARLAPLYHWNERNDVILVLKINM